MPPHSILGHAGVATITFFGTDSGQAVSTCSRGYFSIRSSHILVIGSRRTELTRVVAMTVGTAAARRAVPRRWGRDRGNAGEEIRGLSLFRGSADERAVAR